MILADLKFKENIKKIINEGCWDQGPRPKWQDGSPANSKFITGVFETYDLSQGQLPLTTLRKIPVKSAIKEILWIYQDQSNDLKLLKEKYDIHWWDSWESDLKPGTIGLRYGHTIKKWNQIEKLLEGLKSNPYSRRHIMSLWDQADFASSDGLYPCAYETIWSVREQGNRINKVLDLTLIQRSCDYLTAGHINKIQYVCLQMMVARHCGFGLGKFNHLVQNLHIYDLHIPNANILLNTDGSINNPSIYLKADKTNFFDLNIDDFIISDYNPIHTDLKFDLAI